MATIDVKTLTKAVAQLVKVLNPRNRDIVSRRFGLKNGTKETLESIGQSYGITRERVRQIEEFALAQLTKNAAESRDVVKAVAAAKDLISREGGVMRERSLFAAVSGSEKDSAANASLTFALTLDSELVRLSDNDHFHAFWARDDKMHGSFKQQVATLTGALQTHGAVVALDQLQGIAAQAGVTALDGSRFTDRHLAATMAVCKDIGSNIFGQFGLTHWTQICPKGVRDKAYLGHSSVRQAAAL